MTIFLRALFFLTPQRKSMRQSSGGPRNIKHDGQKVQEDMTTTKTQFDLPKTTPTTELMFYRAAVGNLHKCLFLKIGSEEANSTQLPVQILPVLSHVSLSQTLRRSCLQHLTFATAAARTNQASLSTALMLHPSSSFVHHGESRSLMNTILHVTSFGSESALAIALRMTPFDCFHRHGLFALLLSLNVF